MLMASAALYWIWECGDADAGNNMPISSFSDNRDKACDTRALLQHMLSINSDHQLERIEVISNQTTLTTFFSRLIHIHELIENREETSLVGEAY
jgi:hypothetical protein